jgi:hypothetical protein
MNFELRSIISLVLKLYAVLLELCFLTSHENHHMGQYAIISKVSV